MRLRKTVSAAGLLLAVAEDLTLAISRYQPAGATIPLGASQSC